MLGQRTDALLVLQVLRLPCTGGPCVAGGQHILRKAKLHYIGTAKVGEKGQIVIPKDARQIFGVKPGDTLLILGDEETGIIVTKPDVLRDAADDIFGKMEK